MTLLAKGLHQRGHEVTVMVFYGGGFFEPELAAAGVPLISLEKRGRWDMTGFLWRLVRRLREARPEVVYSFLPVPNLIAALVKPLLPGARLVWGLRVSMMDMAHYDRLSRWIYRLEGWMARLPARIIANSERGREFAIERGFPGPKLAVVFNGIDTGRFQPDPGAGRRLRAEWGIGEDDFLVGHVGRLDPMKDHPNFLRAAAVFSSQWKKARFVCVGGGPEDYGAALLEMSDALGLSDALHWAGAREDLTDIYNALDVFTLPSIREGFPNVVGEAMACGVPCVVTDVGDAARITGKEGWVVEPGNPEALAGAWLEIARMDAGQRREAGRRAVERIQEHFTLARMIEETEVCLTNL